MIRDTMRNNASATPAGRKIAALRELLPGCFGADGSIDFGRLREELGGGAATTDDGYSLHFLGRDYANLLASVDTETVIQPDEEHNSRPENRHSQNIYISGDNLDALKHLLRSYARRVKCIYIDPPYNTGTDGFVYSDRFSFTPEQLTRRLGISDEEARRTLDMTSRHSASHSAWLAFMSPRLQLARDLLAPDGVIFISIDDNEQANLRLLCDRVFGEENMIAQFCKKGHGGKQDSTHYAKVHEYILCYARQKFKAGEEEKEGYKYPHTDSQGRHYKTMLLRKWGDAATRADRPNMFYPLYVCGESVSLTPTGGLGETALYPMLDDTTEGRWRWGKDTMADAIKMGLVEVKRDGEVPTAYERIYEPSEDNTPTKLFTTWIDDVNNNSGKKLLKTLFGGASPFDYPKPVELIKRIIKMGNAMDGYVVDFFSGSATTAHAVMEMNAEDGDHRKFIMVQWPEPCNEKSAAYKDFHFRTIDQIGMERIKLAAKKIREEHPGTEADLGFRHFTLRDVPQDVLDRMEKFDPQQATFADNTLQAFGRATVLATWMERDGYGLCAEAEPTDLAGYTAYTCGDHLYLLDEGLTDEAVTALVDRYAAPGSWCPHNVVLFGYSFTFGQTDALRTNLPLLEEGEKQVRINIDVRY